MEVTKTRSQVIHEAAYKLQIVGEGQPLEAERYQRISDNFDPLMLQLATDGICNVVSDSAIPSEWFDSLAGLLGNINAPLAGKSFDPQIKTFYEMQLRKMNSSGPYYSVMSTDYF